MSLTAAARSGNQRDTVMGDSDPVTSATGFVAAVRVGQVTSRELTGVGVRRIERHDRRLDTVVVRDFERARRSDWPIARRHRQPA
jgi:Asp-tRNA(Asn)/Glu-tRNA(Gln) amidotransferase A subunit family amidase